MPHKKTYILYCDKNRDNNAIKNHYICMFEILYKNNGVNALSYKWLKDKKDEGHRHFELYNKMVIKFQLTMEDLSKKFNAHHSWITNRKQQTQLSKGQNIWNDELFDKISKEIINKYEYIPPAEFLRANGYSDYVTYIYRSNYNYEFLNNKFNVEKKPFLTCRNGMRFRSLAEASCANFLYSRGIDIKQGERYPEEYEQTTGRKYGMYDIHFKACIGDFKDKWIDCEIWGDNPNGHGEEEYAIKRKQKETFNLTNQYFLGIPYKDCYDSDNLSVILEPYIGDITPYVFNSENDKKVDPAKWNLIDDVKMKCEWIMENNNGEIPSEGWLRKRGIYANRETYDWEKKYNLSSLAVDIQRIGGIRVIRDLLQTTNKSTITWDKKKIIELFKDVYAKYNNSPYSVLVKLKRQTDKEKIVSDKELQNQLSTVIGGGCNRYFEGGYREACICANIPCRKAPTKLNL